MFLPGWGSLSLICTTGIGRKEQNELSWLEGRGWLRALAVWKGLWWIMGFTIPVINQVYHKSADNERLPKCLLTSMVWKDQPGTAWGTGNCQARLVFTSCQSPVVGMKEGKLRARGSSCTNSACPTAAETPAGREKGEPWPN